MTWTCELCFPNSTEVGIIAPGYALVREKGRYKILGGQGHRGDFIYTFRRKPVWDPDYEALLLDDDLEAEALMVDDGSSDRWLHNQLDTCWKTLKLPAHEGYWFINSCVEVGFYPERGGFAYWLINKCALLIDMYDAGVRV
jgi:hypothetical protein